MNAIESDLLDRLRQLPPHRLAQVSDFVDFLAAREGLANAAQRFTDSLRLDALNLPPICADLQVEDTHR